jgi:hypothetical protein
VTEDARTPIERWEDAVVTAHGGDCERKPLLTTTRLITAGDYLVAALRNRARIEVALRRIEAYVGSDATPVHAAIADIREVL